MDLNCKCNSTADVVLVSDDVGKYYLSRDNGNSFTEIASDNSWQTVTEFAIENPTKDTIIQFEIKNSGGGPGGLISTISYGGKKSVTTNPIDSGIFEVVSASNGNIYDLEYSPRASSTWNIDTRTRKIADAYWIWNSDSSTDATMLFQFNFSKILDADYGNFEFWVVMI